jgi:hypothetical protein
MVQRYTPKQIQYNIRTRKMTTKTSRKKEKVNVEEEIMAGYTLRNILRLLWQNRFRVDRKYFLRFLYGLGVSALLWPLRTLEWLITAPRIAATRIEKDPVFIIGYYRSGTTYLITLFSKDPNRAYVSNVEGYLPTLFLGFPRLARWIINMSIPESRPMDNVVMTPEEPTEEEYSIGAYEKYSIYNGFVWPRNFKLYSRYNSFDGLPDDLERWKRRHHWFTRKLTASYHGKQIVYKNPTATFRIKHILQLYPNARFVHIYRNPYEVLSSNIRYHADQGGYTRELRRNVPEVRGAEAPHPRGTSRGDQVRGFYSKTDGTHRAHLS